MCLVLRAALVILALCHVTSVESRATSSPSPPTEFSWVLPGLLAASAFPSDAENFIFLQQQGITTIVSLTLVPAPVPEGMDFKVISIPIRDYTVTTFQQADEFVDAILTTKYAGEKMLVHCKAGHGRTGTLVASYFVNHFDMDCDTAINVIREMRPGSIDNIEQEEFVCDYKRYLDDQRNNFS